MFRFWRKRKTTRERKSVPTVGEVIATSLRDFPGAWRIDPDRHTLFHVASGMRLNVKTRSVFCHTATLHLSRRDQRIIYRAYLEFLPFYVQLQLAEEAILTVRDGSGMINQLQFENGILVGGSLP